MNEKSVEKTATRTYKDRFESYLNFGLIFALLLLILEDFGSTWSKFAFASLIVVSAVLALYAMNALKSRFSKKSTESPKGNTLSSG